MPPRTQRRAGPRPAPVITQDLYTEKALHERPNKGDGGRRHKKSGAANGTPSASLPVPTAELPNSNIDNGSSHNGSSDNGTSDNDSSDNDSSDNDSSDNDSSDNDSSDNESLAALPADGQPQLAPPRPAPRRPGLIPTDIADTIGPVIGKAVADIKAHEDGSRRGGDIEDVHKMRVATRRVRAYLKAARPALDRTATDRIRGDVRELAATLGVIRDHDVMIDRLHTEAGKLGDPDTGALEHLVNRLESERIRGRDQLVSELDDPSYSALLTELEEAAAQPPVADPWADLRDLAANEWWTLEKAHRKLHKNFGKNPPNDELHELRIYGKRARYAAELLHEKGDMAAFLEALAALQEVLGDHQDACVLEDRLRELVDESGDPHAGIAAGRVIEGCHQRRVAARAAYPAAWKGAEAAGRKAFPG